MRVEFRVDGVPAPQGSKTAYRRGARVILVESSDRLPAWRDTVTLAARRVKRPDAWLDTATPLEAVYRFRLPRPKTVKRALPTVKPDLDKLTRAIGDALTDARLYGDDAQVVRLTVEKTYGTPGVEIEIKDYE